MTNKKQLTNNCLSNKDLDNIAKMLERLMILELRTSDYKYMKGLLDRNYNYSNIVNYLNDVAIPLIDDILDQPNDEAVLPISYETH